MNELFLEEYRALREELHNLKKCQITFLTFAITTTGFLWGLTSKQLSIAGVFLLPLAILIPFWWIFFDKATTITRIVGYYRVLEQLITKKLIVKNFLGWENYLGEFRQEVVQTDEIKLTPFKITELMKHLKSRKKSLFTILSLKTSHKYWVLVNYAFAGLSFLCIIITFLKFTWWNTLCAVLALLITGISLLWNTFVVLELITGSFSYDKNTEKWRNLIEQANQQSN